MILNNIMFPELMELYTNPNNLKQLKNKTPPITIVNGLPFHFDKNFKRIGVSFSGGADSTLLLYILCKLIRDTNSSCKIYPITMIRFFRDKPWLEHVAVDVFNKLNTEFSDILEPITWGFIPEDFEMVKIEKLGLETPTVKQFRRDLANCDVLISAEFMTYQVLKNKLEYIYNGTTVNPPIETTNEPKFRTAKVVGKNYNYVIGTIRISPFALITKDWIMAQYKNFKLENLLSLTRSCQYGKHDAYKTWKKGDAYPSECKECFFCQEKDWAISNNEKYIIKESE